MLLHQSMKFTVDVFLAEQELCRLLWQWLNPQSNCMEIWGESCWCLSLMIHHFNDFISITSKHDLKRWHAHAVKGTQTSDCLTYLIIDTSRVPPAFQKPPPPPQHPPVGFELSMGVGGELPLLTPRWAEITNINAAVFYIYIIIDFVWAVCLNYYQGATKIAHLKHLNHMLFAFVVLYVKQRLIGWVHRFQSRFLVRFLCPVHSGSVNAVTCCTC